MHKTNRGSETCHSKSYSPSHTFLVACSHSAATCSSGRNCRIRGPSSPSTPSLIAPAVLQPAGRTQVGILGHVQDTAVLVRSENTPLFLFVKTGGAPCATVAYAVGARSTLHHDAKHTRSRGTEATLVTARA
eukprot:6210530-Pleurochrysis_carterae.AAC.2